MLFERSNIEEEYETVRGYSETIPMMGWAVNSRVDAGVSDGGAQKIVCLGWALAEALSVNLAKHYMKQGDIAAMVVPSALPVLAGYPHWEKKVSLLVYPEVLSNLEARTNYFVAGVPITVMETIFDPEQAAAFCVYVQTVTDQKNPVRWVSVFCPISYPIKRKNSCGDIINVQSAEEHLLECIVDKIYTQELKVLSLSEAQNNRGPWRIAMSQSISVPFAGFCIGRYLRDQGLLIGPGLSGSIWDCYEPVVKHLADTGCVFFGPLPDAWNENFLYEQSLLLDTLRKYGKNWRPVYVQRIESKIFGYDSQESESWGCAVPRLVPQEEKRHYMTRLSEYIRMDLRSPDVCMCFAEEYVSAGGLLGKLHPVVQTLSAINIA